MIGTLRASDVYMDILDTLPNEEKLDLISKLVKSMKKAVTVKKKPGAMGSGTCAPSEV